MHLIMNSVLNKSEAFDRAHCTTLQLQIYRYSTCRLLCVIVLLYSILWFSCRIIGTVYRQYLNKNRRGGCCFGIVVAAATAA